MSEEGSLKLTRRCILCDADDYEILFTYTYDFLTNVRNTSAEWLEEIGWCKDITSSIVKCKNCGGTYVRDVFLNYEQLPSELTEEQVANLENISKDKKFISKTQSVWVLCNIISLANTFFDNIKLLDYGAGSGSWCNLARALGVTEVFAYEPYNRYHPKFYKKYNFPGIVASRSWEEIEKYGPFDVVICNSVFEHLSNPKKDINQIHKNMTRGGYFYVNQPFMNLAKEINSLKRAKNIVKKMPISHYHPGHVNYLTNSQFRLFLKNFGFNIINIGVNPLIPHTSGFLQRIKKNIGPFLPLLIATGIYKPWQFILKKV